MKLDCPMEASGINEIMIFNTLRFERFEGYTGRIYWDKYVYNPADNSFFVSYAITDHQMMKMVKELAKKKNTHVWVSMNTLNITWKKDKEKKKEGE